MPTTGGQEFGFRNKKANRNDPKHPLQSSVIAVIAVHRSYVSKYVSKGLAAEVQARPLRK